MPTSDRLRTRAWGSGFTLVELLTVIIIITLLASILLPTVISALVTGYTVNSTAMISNLSSGCTEYKADTHMYPGQMYYTDSSKGLKGGGGPFTGSQYLACCMFDYSYAEINTYPAPDAKSGYGTYKPEFLYQDPLNNVPNVLADGFPPGQQRPVLYYPSIPKSDGPDGISQYNYTDNATLCNPNAPDNENSANFQTFIEDPRYNNEAVNPGEYLLICAGQDRMFFTADDITNMHK